MIRLHQPELYICLIAETTCVKQGPKKPSSDAEAKVESAQSSAESASSEANPCRV